MTTNGIDRSSSAGGSGAAVTPVDVNVVDAKGDLIVGTADNAVDNLTVGSDGDIVLPVSGAATGLAWFRHPFGGAALINGKIARSVGASALTIAVKTIADADPSAASPVYVMVPTLTSNVFDGGYVIRKITAALSLVISSGSTLGHTSAVASAVYVYLLDNAGTLELAASSKFFGSHSVQSSTAEGGAGAADTAATLYSTTARSNVAVSCLQRWKSTQTVAGTWAATTGEVQLYPFPYKAPSTQVFTATGANTYTKPWDMLSARITLVAGGGGSGGVALTGAAQAAGASGGGGGGAAIKTLAADVIGATETATVGAGGIAAVAGQNSGGTGGTSSFGAHCSATGGTGGSGSPASGANTCGASGVAGGVGSSGDVNLKGGGSNSGATYGVVGVGVGGIGGGSLLSGPGESSATAGVTTGVAGGVYGGGASGAASGASQVAQVGSVGGQGIVIVEERYI